MKRAWKKIIYIGMGVVLFAGTLLTGQYGLSEKDKEIYEIACAQQDNVDDLGFGEFRLADYPLAYYDGEYDYVITNNGSSYQVEKRKPVLNTFVGTAYPVEEHYEVIVPAIENFQKLFNTLNTAGQLGSMSGGDFVSFEVDSYGEKEQVATIWHEAFHAYQFTYAEDEITALLDGHTFENGDLGENMIVEVVDANPEIRAIYQQELELLKQAVKLTEGIREDLETGIQTITGENKEADVDTLRKVVLQYKQLEQERMGMLSDEVLILEEYYKRLEGSAYYVEGFVYQSLYSKEAFQKKYIEDIDMYTEGSTKYYKIGMAQCQILDWLKPEWKTDYDFSECFMDLIYERLGI